MKNVYAIFDKIAKVYHAPFTQNNNAEAMRSFGKACQDENTGMFSNPEDYEIYHIGTWDEYEGKIKGMQHNTLLARAIDFQPNQTEKLKEHNANPNS